LPTDAYGQSPTAGLDGTFDILGARLGQPATEAEALARMEMTDPVGWSADPGRSDTEPGSAAILLRERNGAQAIQIAHRPDGSVTSIARWVEFIADPPPLGPVEAILGDKYGDPDHTEALPAATILAWIARDDIAPENRSACRAALVGSVVDWRVAPGPWTDPDGKPAMFEAADALAQSPSKALPTTLPGIFGTGPFVACPEIVVAAIVRDDTGRVRRLLTAIAHPAAAQAATSANTDAADSGLDLKL
jgi:hypothetical protein